MLGQGLRWVFAVVCLWLSFSVAIAQEPAVEALRAEAKAKPDCAVAVPIWWEITELEPEDTEAWRAIAICAQTQDPMIEDAKGIFGSMFGFDASLRDLLRRAGEGDRTAATDLLKAGRERLTVGDPRGAVELLRQVVALEPDSSDGQYQLGFGLVDSGRVEEAREAFQKGLHSDTRRARATFLYALAMVYPRSFAGFAAALVAVTMAWAMRRSKDMNWGTLIPGVFVVMAMGAWFSVSGDRVIFLALLSLAAVSTIWLIVMPLRSPLARAADGVLAVAAGEGHRRMNRLSWWMLAVVTILPVIALLEGVPRISAPWIRLCASFLCAMLLFSAVGTWLLRALSRATTLRVTLRGLGLVGTVPFLLFYLYFERDALEQLVFGTSLDPSAVDRLAGYVIVWTAGFTMALVLARILADSLLEPIHRVTAAVAAVRSGDFQQRVRLERSDEIGVLAGAVDEMAEGLAHREAIKDTFRRFVASDVADLLMSGDESVRKPRRIHGTVLFADIRGFTSFSEAMDPERVVDLLNGCFSRLEPVVRRWGGTIDKFLGDGILAVWDVPEPRRVAGQEGVSGEELAVRAALGMLEALHAYNEEIQMLGVGPLRMGIGVHSGELVAGPIGSPDRLEYTVIGDVVNTAQRVEAQARDAPLLVTDAVAKKLPTLETIAREPVVLKGKLEPVVLYEVRGFR